jgi:hypothetical protein
VHHAPALTAITGSIIAMAVAASGAAAFHHAMVSPDVPPPFHLDIRLESLHGGHHQVYVEMAMTHADGPVWVGGSLERAIPAYQARGGMLVYEGLLNATTPVHPGDILYVVVYHPYGEHVVEVMVW